MENAIGMSWPLFLQAVKQSSVQYDEDGDGDVDDDGDDGEDDLFKCSPKQPSNEGLNWKKSSWLIQLYLGREAARSKLYRVYHDQAAFERFSRCFSFTHDLWFIAIFGRF